MSESSQREAIANYLKSGQSLTPLEALQKFGTFRLAARCHELRKEGLPIFTQMVEVNGKKVASYHCLAA